jgi:hypothetical protein
MIKPNECIIKNDHRVQSSVLSRVSRDGFVLSILMRFVTGADRSFTLVYTQKLYHPFPMMYIVQSVTYFLL